MNTLSLTPGISVRRLDLSEYKEAASLSLEIYLQTGEEDFDEQGLETFKSFVNDEAMINSLVIYGAFAEARLVGVMAVKNERKHISLFFIREAYHRKGIGRR
ncbi:GNAT family N-acetyltransferase, partial [Bacteroides cellulosilyticus]